jgi:excisionase family DNA binding protein
MSVHELGRHFAAEGTMTKKQIAAYLQYSTRWVEYQVKDHGMPFIQAGAYKRFRLSEVLTWLETRS